jgi:hypothetical protein
VVDGQAVGDHSERAPTFQLLCSTPEDPNTQIDPVVERFDNNSGLPDPGLTGHQERLANPTSDLPHRRPNLVQLSGATDQTAFRVGANIPRHRDASLNRLPVDGTHVAEPCSSAPSQTIRHLASASQS